MEVELTGDTPQKGLWPVALISGYANHVTITSSATPEAYPNDSYIMVSQHWREWRHRPNADIDARSTGNVGEATRESTIINQTGQMVILGENTMNNEVISKAGIYDKGRNNRCVGPMRTPVRMRVEDTWGSYTLE
jgi:hypothetical protein